MRVCLITGDLSPASGGVAVSVPALVRELEQLPDIEVHVLGTLDPSAPEAWRNWGRNVHAVPQYGVRAFHWAPAMGSILRDLDPDVVDVQGLWMNVSRVSRMFHSRTGRPYMITPRGMLDPWSLRHARWKKELTRRWFEDEHLRRARCLRATAPMELRHIRAHGLRNAIAVVDRKSVV